MCTHKHTRRCALLLITWPPLQAAHAALPEHLKSALVLITRPVPHTALLPHCSCILHPGGSGTTAAGASVCLVSLLLLQKHLQIHSAYRPLVATYASRLFQSTKVQHTNIHSSSPRRASDRRSPSDVSTAPRSVLTRGTAGTRGPRFDS